MNQYRWLFILRDDVRHTVLRHSAPPFDHTLTLDGLKLNWLRFAWLCFSNTAINKSIAQHSLIIPTAQNQELIQIDNPISWCHPVPGRAVWKWNLVRGDSSLGEDRKSFSSPLGAPLAPQQPKLPPPATSFIKPIRGTAGRKRKSGSRKWGERGLCGRELINRWGDKEKKETQK